MLILKPLCSCSSFTFDSFCITSVKSAVQLTLSETVIIIMAGNDDQSVASWKTGHVGSICPVPTVIFACRKIFRLSENIRPKMQNLELKKPNLGEIKGKI